MLLGLWRCGQALSSLEVAVKATADRYQSICRDAKPLTRGEIDTWAPAGHSSRVRSFGRNWRERLCLLICFRLIIYSSLSFPVRLWVQEALFDYKIPDQRDS